MKIAITGTSGGLGSALKKRFEDLQDSTVLCLNRPEYDLDGDLEKFLVDFDVFVNCAYSTKTGFAQTQLLYKLFEANKMRECQIINVGSVSGDGDRSKYFPYAVEKAALEKACIQLSLIPGRCRVSLIKPGRMLTKMTDHRSEYYRMSPDNVVEAILWMSNQPKELVIKSLTIDIHNSQIARL